MRQYRFRGKRVDTKEWVYGFLFELSYDGIPCLCIGIEPLSANDYGEIHQSCYEEVIPETVGQFTGLMDNSEEIAETEDKEVYEGDIVCFDYKIDGKYKGITATVKYEAGTFILTSTQLPDDYIPILEIVDFDGDCCWVDGIVSGNIHDNPELLEVSRE